MFVYWEDLDLVDEGLLSDACSLDEATGHFVDDLEGGLPFFAGVRPRRSARAAWGASMYDPSAETFTRARTHALELRRRRTIVAAIADPTIATTLSHVLDGDGSALQREVLDRVIAGRREPRRTALHALVARIEADRPRREGALRFEPHWYADDDAYTELRLEAFDAELRRHAPELAERAADSRALADRSAVWERIERLHPSVENEPPWLPDVLAWRREDAAVASARRRSLLARIDRWLAATAPAVHATLGTPASEAHLDACAATLGRELPPALRELCAWHDGGGRILPVGFGYAPLPIAAMLERHVEHVAAFPDAPQWFGPGWIPCFENPSGDCLVVDCDGDLGGVPGQIVQFEHDSCDRTIVAYDVESLLETWVAMCEGGAFATQHDPIACISDADWEAWATRLTGSRWPVFEVAPGR